jgi:hypothetical protein
VLQNLPSRGGFFIRAALSSGFRKNHREEKNRGTLPEVPGGSAETGKKDKKNSPLYLPSVV